MKLAAALLLSLIACSNEPSKLEGKVKVAGGSGTAVIPGQIGASLQRIEERLKALEDQHKVGGGGPNDPVADRIHRIEVNLARREEALGFLELYYDDQKKQMEAKEAEEHDPDAVFAVDVSGPIKAGQVEGPNSATVTVVEAWDFA